MKTGLIILAIFFIQFSWAQFPPAADEAGTTAIHKDSSVFVNWASGVVDFERGRVDITDPESELASFGTEEEALGVAEGTSTDVVSLGDGGWITLEFPEALRNGSGPDFAIFENSFTHDYLELAHVEVSTDGDRFVRIPSISNVATETQTGSFASTDPTLIHNLAGKYIQGFGTPFDLADVADSTGIDINNIQFIKIIDVVGSIDPTYGTYDSEGQLINDPFKTDFESGGFDLDGVGVINDQSHSLNLPENEMRDLNIYPNPTTGILFLDIDLNALASIHLYDYSGQLIYSGNTNELNLLGLNIESGLYLLEIKKKDGSILRKSVRYQP